MIGNYYEDEGLLLDLYTNEELYVENLRKEIKEMRIYRRNCTKAANSTPAIRYCLEINSIQKNT